MEPLTAAAHFRDGWRPTGSAASWPQNDPDRIWRQCNLELIEGESLFRSPTPCFAAGCAPSAHCHVPATTRPACSFSISQLRAESARLGDRKAEEAQCPGS